MRNSAGTERLQVGQDEHAMPMKAADANNVEKQGRNEGVECNCQIVEPGWLRT